MKKKNHLRHLASPAPLLEEKQSICGPPELVAADPRNEGGAAIAIPENASRPPSIARGDSMES